MSIKLSELLQEKTVHSMSIRKDAGPSPSACINICFLTSAASRGQAPVSGVSKKF